MDDPHQFGDTDYVSDTNHVSLSTARENFREHGACAPEEADGSVAADEFDRDPNWPYDR